MKQKSFPLFTTSQLLNSISLLKPYIEPPKKAEEPLNAVQLAANKALSRDVIEDLDTMLDEIEGLIKSDEGLKAVEEEIVKAIESYEFLGTYHYAYMLSELNN